MRKEAAKFVKNELPAHFAGNNPRFVALLEQYYKWLYRPDGMTKREVDDYRGNVDSWYKTDMDKFTQTGNVQYSDRWALNGDEMEARVANFRAPGNWSTRFFNQMFLEREFDEFDTADGSSFESYDGYDFEAKFVDEEAVDLWAKRFNHELMPSRGLSARDEILLLKALKHMYANKGTHKCVQLFFSAYFDEDVEVYVPKFDICVLENNFTLDMDKVLRDDDVYQEYSYVVYVSKDPSYYKKEFEDIYLKNFHPGGFRVVLMKRP